MLDITYHGEPQGRLKPESQIITSAGEDVEKSERCRLLAGRNWKSIWQLLENIYLPYDLVIHL